MAPGIGPAAGLAYFYNLDRFKFDAEQRQDCIHQMQTMRLAQWGLFREDVRDVFQLSTSNMDNYILVGALIVAAVMNFIFVGYPEFPLEPRWVLLLWNNCVFACIFFGLVSVWLAMHGSIAQRSAKVKILTQAVRPPVPSLKDVEGAMRSQEHFEGDGANRYFQPPAFAIPFALAEKDEIPKSQPSTMDPSMRTLPGMSQRKSRARGKTQKEDPVDWLSDAPFAGEEVLQHLRTVDNGGPGRSAVMHSHFWMLRRVQRGYACFDAYARIGLVLAAQHMLLVCAYYSLGHFMSKMDNWPIPAQNPGAAWLSLIAGAFCTTTLFKLDLFCGPKYRNLVQLMLILPPALSGFAIHLAASRTNHGRGGVRPCDQVVPAWAPWGLAILACTGHMLWMWVVLRVSAPLLESSGLPLSFRSTIYLDVFGWHSRHFSAASVRRAVDCAHWENPEKMLYEVVERRPDHKCLVATHREAKQIVNMVSELATSQTAPHLTQEEIDDLRQLHFTLDEHIRDLETQMAMPAVRQQVEGGIERRNSVSEAAPPAWLQTSFLEGNSEEVCWIDCRSGQVVWSMPETGQIIDLFRLGQSLEELQLRIDYSPRSSEQQVLAAEALPFELMPETPDRDVSSSLLPWKCIRWSCMAQMGVWLATIAVLAFDPKYYDSPIAPREMYDSIALQVVQTDWPHDFFRPSALSCSPAGRYLMLGDQFAIFQADVELLGEHSDESVVERMEEEASRNNTHEILSLRTVTLELKVPTTEIDFAFKSFGFLPGKGKLLLLNQGGTEVAEYSLHGHKYVKTWKLSPTLPHKRLEIIQPLEGPESAQCARDGSGFMNVGWLVYAATDSGQVVTLCPTHRNELHPLHMLISLRRRRPSQDVVEVVDSHTGTTKASAQTVIGVYHEPGTGLTWLLNTNTEGVAEVVVFDTERAKGGPLGRWPLPSGRWWVPGICSLGGGQGFLLAAAADTDRAGQVGGPELWRLVPRQRGIS